MRRLAILLALAVCPAVLAARQQPAPAQKPTFRTATELIAIDVSIVDRDGRPVSDLRSDEFVVKVDGQVRRIASVQFVDQSVRQVPVSRAPAIRPVVSSNEAGGGGRLVLIVVDEASIKFGGLRGTVESASRLLAGFGASDRIGLAALPGPRMIVDFGRDRQRVIDALKRIPGGAMPMRGLTDHQLSVTEAYAFERADSATVNDVIARECAAERGMAAQACAEEVRAAAKELVTQVRNDLAQFSAGFRALLQALAANDVPKIVILFSEGLLSPEAASDLTWVGYEAAAARTVIHTMRLDRTMFDASQRNPRMDAFFEERGYSIASLDVLSGASRGSSFEISAGSQGPFDRLAREVSGYYLLGMEPESADRDGRHHRIQVQALRPGVTVRARTEFALPTTRPAPVAGGDAKVLMATMQSPMLSTDIPLRLATFNMADEDAGKVRVMVSAEIDRQQEKDGAAQVGYAIYNDQGKPLVAFSQAMDLRRTESGALGFVSVAAVPAGSYTLKLAAVREGRAGSVEHAFTARLTSAASLRLGDLVVSDAIVRDRPMPPSLDSHVVGDSILAFVQMRGDRDLPKSTELVLDVVKTEDGRALLSAPLSVGASKTSVRMAQAVLEGRLLPPGEYAARLTVSVGGKPAGKLFTQFSLDRTAHAANGGRGLTLGVAPAPFAREEVLSPNVIAAFLDGMPVPRSESVRTALESVKAGRFDEAVQRLGATGDNDPLPPFIRGLDLYAKGQLDPAANAFRQAIRAAPDFVVGMFYIAACYAAGGREQHAINAWQTSLISLDQFPFVYRFLVDALLRAGQAEKAAGLLDEASGRWPDDEGLRLRAAKAAAAAGHSERVLEYLDRFGDRPVPDANLLFLGMYALFQQALDSAAPPAEGMLERLTHYRDAYAAAAGPYQPLVAEWVAFVEQKSKRTR